MNFSTTEHLRKPTAEEVRSISDLIRPYGLSDDEALTSLTNEEGDFVLSTQGSLVVYEVNRNRLRVHRWSNMTGSESFPDQKRPGREQIATPMLLTITFQNENVRLLATEPTSLESILARLAV